MEMEMEMEMDEQECFGNQQYGIGVSPRYICTGLDSLIAF